jgi:hypothetical protein
MCNSWIVAPWILCPAQDGSPSRENNDGVAGEVPTTMAMTAVLHPAMLPGLGLHTVYGRIVDP